MVTEPVPMTPAEVARAPPNHCCSRIMLTTCQLQGRIANANIAKKGRSKLAMVMAHHPPTTTTTSKQMTTQMIQRRCQMVRPFESRRDACCAVRAQRHQQKLIRNRDIPFEK